MAQQTNKSDSPSLPVSPALIVGLVILAAFVVILVSASVCRYCRRDGPTCCDCCDWDSESDHETFNPFGPRSEAQNERMREVRRINRMYAWERAREARMEIGELRPPSMMMGRMGHDRTWDEWSVHENTTAANTDTHSGDDLSRTTYFYNVDAPYPNSSQDRLSHLALPRRSVRQSYQTSCSSGCSPNGRHQSVLLPQPVIARRESPVHQRSSLRREYQAYYNGSGHEAYMDDELPTTPKMPMPMRSVTRRPTPKITINDDTNDMLASPPNSPAKMEEQHPDVAVRGHGNETEPQYLEDGSRGAGVEREADHFEALSLDSGPDLGLRVVLNDVDDDDNSPPVHLSATLSEPFPPTPRLPLNFHLVHDGHDDDDDDEGQAREGATSTGPVKKTTPPPPPSGQSQQHTKPDETASRIQACSRDGVKSMIHEWERAHGRFDRAHNSTRPRRWSRKGGYQEI